MDFKKLFRKDDKAVSPVIGVILMVAITVILAAAIGSSVFGMGPAKSAPQANLEIKASHVPTSGSNPASIKIEHIGGDAIHFEDSGITKVMASVNSGPSVEINADVYTNNTKILGTMGVGDVKILELIDTSNVNLDEDSTANVDPIDSGDTVNIKIIDVQTNQLICDKDIRF
ncbi:type IV pilin [Methanosarcina sp.]|uniref:type IV pilin n=1 Tax=Methanosarcina sp. TaxID=2213 RepID=UPI00298894AC|nr:type IV pilin [Methanosarcina sp.]MDW5550005.1 type IV pilin [Methanosarcina sp.]MDW5553959.1 type IV pilin [Methanosarcina sp.]MDW5558536.1 type IV pilin [Methanosarcina sp.]